MLAFDLDGPTSSALRGEQIWTASRRFLDGGYGPFRGLPRVLAMLAELELPATFFVPSWVVEQWTAACETIVAAGHEVAGHGHLHESFFELSVEEQHDILGRSQDVFDRLLGARARGFRAPSGDWHPETPRLLVEHGHDYSSSFRDDHLPYVKHVGATRPLVEIPARVDLDDYAYFAYTEEPPFPRGQDRIAPYRTVVANWRREFAGHHEVGGCISTIWHPKVSATPGRTRALSELLADVAGWDGVWFATGSQIADHVLATVSEVGA